LGADRGSGFFHGGGVAGARGAPNDDLVLSGASHPQGGDLPASRPTPTDYGCSRLAET
jgi:hypothetical protein